MGTFSETPTAGAGVQTRLLRTGKDWLLRRIRYSTQSFQPSQPLNPWLGSIYGPRPYPQGLQNSAQSFNLGNPHNNRFALTRGERCGYQMKLELLSSSHIQESRGADWD
jgi:hypothetical protein